MTEQIDTEVLIAWIESQVKDFAAYMAPYIAQLNEHYKAMMDQSDTTPALAIRRYRLLEVSTKAKAATIAPVTINTDTLNAIKGYMMKRARADNVNSYRTDEGTGYISGGFSPIVENQDLFLDWCLAYNEGMISLKPPTVEAMKEHLSANKNLPPPGIRLDTWARFNISGPK